MLYHQSLNSLSSFKLGLSFGSSFLHLLTYIKIKVLIYKMDFLSPIFEGRSGFLSIFSFISVGSSPG